MRLPILVFHICAGTIGLLSGAVGIAVRKGSRQHRVAGNVFLVSMLSLAVSAVYLSFMKHQISLGCTHAQPKKSAVPIFRRMLASHERSLLAARGHSEPAGQIAAREIEIVRIKGALQRAEELSDDVAAAIERAS
jgi:uncharacterized membrane protein